MRGTPAVSATASMNFSDAWVRSCCLVTLIGPPLPRSALAPPSQSSIRLKLGSTSANDQPLHPAARLRDPAPPRGRLRNGVEPPVKPLLQGRHVVEDRDHPRLAHQPGPIRAAGLEQDDAGARLGQAFGEHTAGAAG